MRLAFWTLVLTLSVSAQEPSQDQIRSLVQQLQSDVAQEREKATRTLAEIGIPALAELEKAAGTLDQEGVARVRYLIRLIDVRRRLGPSAKTILIDIEQRLARGEGVNAFLEAAACDVLGRRRHPTIEIADLAALANFAIQEAKDAQEKTSIMDAVRVRRIRGAAAGVAYFLKATEPDVRRTAIMTLSSLNAVEQAPALVPLLDDPSDRIGTLPSDTLLEFRSRATIPALLERLHSSKKGVRQQALQILIRLHVPEATPFLFEELQDPESSLWRGTDELLWELNENVLRLQMLPLLRSTAANTRRSALEI